MGQRSKFSWSLVTGHRSKRAWAETSFKIMVSKIEVITNHYFKICAGRSAWAVNAVSPSGLKALTALAKKTK